MALLQINHVRFDADLVAFDKDGTLIEFDWMWARVSEAWIESLIQAMDVPTIAGELQRTLGYDPIRRTVIPQSPLAIASTNQLEAIMASVLYRHGTPWPEAEDLARAAIRQTSAELPLAGLVRPTGDVLGLVSRLKAADVRVAVVTTDHRAETEETLRILGIDRLVDALVCGDDGIPIKPAPDMLLVACERANVEPARTLVVGDTEADMLMAQRAGAGLGVAVLTGAGEPSTLATLADVVVPSIAAITLSNSG